MTTITPNLWFDEQGLEAAEFYTSIFPNFKFNEAVSFEISCEDQDEVDRYTERLIADGGEQGPCGWVKDRYGLSWQVVPKQLVELIGDGKGEQAERVMSAMMKM